MDPLSTPPAGDASSPPSLEEQADALVAGLATEPPGGEGANITFPGEKVPGAEPGKTPDADAQRIEELTRRLETAEGRLADTQKSWQEQHSELLASQKAQAEAEAERQRQEEAARLAKELEIPKISPDDAADPELLAQHFEKFADTLERRVQGALYPTVQQVTRTANTLAPLTKLGAEIALERAEPLVEAAGLDVADFRKHRLNIRDEFLKLGEDGVNLMLDDPKRIVVAYTAKKIQDDDTITTPAGSEPPLVLGARPNPREADPEREQKIAAVKAHYGANLNNVLGAVDLHDVNLTMDELDRLYEGIRRR
jgi:hypothetical protein